VNISGVGAGLLIFREKFVKLGSKDIREQINDFSKRAEMKILIVDDSSTIRVFIERLLNLGGYKDIVMAESAMEAFQILGMRDKGTTSTDIDVIMLDVVMPKIDGLSVCKKIRERDYLRNIPIVMVSGNEEKKDMEEALKCGANHYLTKPIQKAELHAVMQKIESELNSSH